MIPVSAIRAKLAALRFCNECEVDVVVQRELQAMGVDIDHIANLIGPVCLFGVTFLEGGTFVFDRFGTSAFVFIVTGEDSETEVDLCAWCAADADIFGTLLGQAAMLGSDRVFNPATYYGGKPCRLLRTPLTWLQAGCEGAVVLQALPASITLAKAPGKLAAEDMDHADQLVRSGAVHPSKLVVPATTLPTRRAA